LLQTKLLQDFPDTARKNHKKGTVVAVGNGTKEHNDCEN
jgi:co-chaperonin GroES (HSP10)